MNISRATKELSIENSRRRKKAITYVTKCRDLPQTTRNFIVLLLNYLNASSAYQVAWPSVSRISKEIKCAERTVYLHLKILKELEIFWVRKKSRSRASIFCFMHMGFDMPIKKCQEKHSFNLYFPNWEHELFTTGRLSEEMCAQIQQRVNPKRLAKLKQQRKTETEKGREILARPSGSLVRVRKLSAGGGEKCAPGGNAPVAAKSGPQTVEPNTEGSEAALSIEYCGSPSPLNTEGDPHPKKVTSIPAPHPTCALSPLLSLSPPNPDSGACTAQPDTVWSQGPASPAPFHGEQDVLLSAASAAPSQQWFRCLRLRLRHLHPLSEKC